jgi:V/A-type H+-transporting ATPase subunit E
MAEELQHLIDRIQKDGIAKAEAEAGRIVAQAKEDSAAIIREAEIKAREHTAGAEKDAELFAERGRKSLEQAARDVVLLVNQAVSDTLKRIVDADVGKALTPDVMKQMMVKLVETYGANKGDSVEIDLLVNPADQKVIVDFFLKEFRSALEKGVEIRADAGVLSGFRASIEGAHVHHEFTRKEIAEALCRLVRPRLAEIVKGSIR